MGGASRSFLCTHLPAIYPEIAGKPSPWGEGVEPGETDEGRNVFDSTNGNGKETTCGGRIVCFIK